MTAANRGKWAEGKLDAEFSKLNSKYANFCHERILDAYSSRGATSSSRAGDFGVYYAGLNFVIEVKTVDHDYRLPRSNFKLDQRARMYKRQLAGSHCFIVIYHSTTKLWRMLPLDYFRKTAEETGSWDMSAEPTLSLDDIMQSLLCRTDAKVSLNAT